LAIASNADWLMAMRTISQGRAGRRRRSGGS
jgi:hypothetical protein